MTTQKENSDTAQTKTNNRYTFVQREGDDYTCIKLLDKKYNGVIYKYGNVQFAKEEREDGRLPMRFDYDIFHNPKKLDLDTEHFLNTIGDILIELMEQQLKDGTAIIK